MLILLLFHQTENATDFGDFNCKLDIPYLGWGISYSFHILVVVVLHQTQKQIRYNIITIQSQEMHKILEIYISSGKYNIKQSSGIW